MRPGDLICLKTAYQTLDPIDRSVGLVIGVWRRNVAILFSSPSGIESFQTHSKGILMMFRIMRRREQEKETV